MGCGVADTLGTKYTHSCVIGARLYGMTWVPRVACKTTTSREDSRVSVIYIPDDKML